MLRDLTRLSQSFPSHHVPFNRAIRGAYRAGLGSRYEELRLLLRSVSHNDNHALRYFELAEAVNDLKPKSVLELGCGHGFASSMFRAERTLSIDINRKSILFAQEHFSDSNHKFLLADLFSYEPSFQFDVVVFSEVIEHVEKDREVLARCASFLGPGGHLVATVPNLDRLQNRLRRLIGAQPVFMSHEHLREYSLVEFLRSIGDVGLEPEWWRGVFIRFPLDDEVAKIPMLGMKSGVRAALENAYPEWCTYILVSALKPSATSDV